MVESVSATALTRLTSPARAVRVALRLFALVSVAVGAYLLLSLLGPVAAAADNGSVEDRDAVVPSSGTEPIRDVVNGAVSDAEDVAAPAEQPSPERPEPKQATTAPSAATQEDLTDRVDEVASADADPPRPVVDAARETLRSKREGTTSGARPASAVTELTVARVTELTEPMVVGALGRPAEALTSIVEQLESATASLPTGELLGDVTSADIDLLPAGTTEPRTDPDRGSEVSPQAQVDSPRNSESGLQAKAGPARPLAPPEAGPNTGRAAPSEVVPGVTDAASPVWAGPIEASASVSTASSASISGTLFTYSWVPELFSIGRVIPADIACEGRTVCPSPPSG